MVSSQSSGVASTLPPMQFGAPINLGKFMEGHSVKPYALIETIKKHRYDLSSDSPVMHPRQDLPHTLSRIYPSKFTEYNQINYGSPELMGGYSNARTSNRYSCN